MKTCIKTIFIIALLMLSALCLTSCETDQYEMGELIAFTHIESYDAKKGELFVSVTASNINENISIIEYSATVSVVCDGRTLASKDYSGAAIAPSETDCKTFTFTDSEVGAALEGAEITVAPRSARLNDSDVLYDIVDKAPSLAEQASDFFGLDGVNIGMSRLSVFLLIVAAVLCIAAVALAALTFINRRFSYALISLILSFICASLSVVCGIRDLDFSLITARLDSFDFLLIFIPIMIVVDFIRGISAFFSSGSSRVAIYALAVSLYASSLAFLLLNMLIAVNLLVSFIICCVAVVASVVATELT